VFVQLQINNRNHQSSLHRRVIVPFRRRLPAHMPRYRTPRNYSRFFALNRLQGHQYLAVDMACKAI
jgi:prophage DNA circulation protein